MDKQRHRFIGRTALLLIALVVGAIVAGLAAAGRGEAIRHFQASATFGSDGTAEVTEHIEYHFDDKRHGIYRVLPDVAPVQAHRVTVSSDNTDQFTVQPDAGGIRLKIGDPGTEISGDHRYVISYPLTTAHLGGDHFGWNGVGATWEVPIEAVDLDLVAPWRWEAASCNVGSSGSIGGCTVRQPVPGRLQVTHGHLDAGEGITVYADRGEALAAAPAARSVVADARPLQWSQRPLTLGLVAAFAFLMVGLVIGALFRRVGRDWVMAGPAAVGAAADLAYDAPLAATAPPGAVRVDDTDLAAWATTEFAPPRGIDAWQGGVVAAEVATPRASVAWLLGAAVNGQVVIDELDPTEPLLRRVPDPTDPEVAALLEVAFAGRDEITLGAYDKDFTAMWTSLPSRFREWYRTSGLADPRASGRAVGARVLGVLGVAAGLILMGAGAAASSSHPLGGLIGVSVGALVGGLGCGAVLWGWELRARTPAGSATWLRIESFRRFIAGSEAEHVRQAAERGVLREYTAWAIALDEVDHWTAAVEAAGLAPSTPGLSTALIASSLSSSITSAGTTPSSSGSGGGVGGGGGGGGGGSW